MPADCWPDPLAPCCPPTHPSAAQDSLPALLDRFAEAARGSLGGSHYSLARYEDIRALAVMLRHLPLSLREAWTFAISPTDPADEPVAAALLSLAHAFALRGRTVTPAAILLPRLAEARSEAELQQARQGGTKRKMHAVLF